MQDILTIFQCMAGSVIVRLIVILIAADVLFGVLRAIKQKTVNSTIGIDGLIRKTAILLVVMVLYIIDVMIQIDFTSFLPQEVIAALHLPGVGLSELFGVMLILFESLSIMKNLSILGLPLPKKFKAAIETFLTNITGEKKEEKK